MITFALSGTFPLALSGTDDSPYQERESYLRTCNKTRIFALNFANIDSYGIYLTQGANSQSVDNFLAIKEQIKVWSQNILRYGTLVYDRIRHAKIGRAHV